MDNKKVVRENSRLTRSFERLRGLKDFFFCKRMVFRGDDLHVLP